MCPSPTPWVSPPPRDLASWAALDPDREAVVVDGTPGAGPPARRITYAALDRAANRLAHTLRAAGLGRGDVLALCGGNDAGVFEAYWAAMRLGLHLVPVNRHLGAGEIRPILGEVATLGKLALATDTGTDAEITTAAAGLDLAARIRFGSGPTAPGAPEDMPDDPWEGQLLLYSSGTSGRPKGVLRDLPDLRPGAGPTLGSELAEGFGLRPGDRYLSPGPLHHSAPLALATACQRAGATAVVMRRFDSARSLDLLASERITVSQWVPTMFVRLLRLPEEVRTAPRDTSAHRVAFHAGAPCPIPVKRAMIEWWGPILVEYYSGTEGGRTMITSPEWLERPGSVGRHWRGGRVWILDDAGAEVPAGVDGRIYFEAPPTGRFRYLHQPEATAAAYLPGDPPGPPDDESRFTLGDIGHVDAGGWLYLTGRSTDLVISGGVNVHPGEVEGVLLEHPAIVDAAVVGVPDDDLGERLAAAVETRRPVDGAELVAHCRGRLAGFKCPRTILVVDALPRSEAGKLDRRAVAALLAGEPGD